MNRKPEELLKDFLDPSKEINRDELQRLIADDPSTALVVMLELIRRARLEKAASPSTPSGQKPIYSKPAVLKKRKKPGQKQGHPGHHRSQPPRIDHRKEHRLEICPTCGNQLQPQKGNKTKRTRIIEDIPEKIEPIVTEHTIYRSYCPCCKKVVEPPVPDALPGAAIGNRLLVLSAHWHYGLGMSISQIVTLLNTHLHFSISTGGLVQMWHRLADRLTPWYEQLVDSAWNSSVLHGDESGWRVNGKTYWIWCFTHPQTTAYFIHPSRGSPALHQFFKDAFEGTLVSDFWSAYDAVAIGKRQFCLAHLLRELEKVDATNSSEEWCAFSKKTKRLFHDALRLRHQDDFSPETYASRIERLNQRLVGLMLITSPDADVKRLANRLKKYWDELLVFLDDPNVPPTNNHAEREIRPAVIMRKVIQGNRSEKGAHTQSVLMSIFRTLKSRDYNPVDILVDSISQSIENGTLPPFPTSFE